VNQYDVLRMLRQKYCFYVKGMQDVSSLTAR
jgi:hypothetical protein